MLANLFSIGDRNYLNNAVVISDALETITSIFGDVTDFKIQFKKPFLSQGEFKISTDKLIGNIVGTFQTMGVNFYFSYTPTDIELENKTATGTDVSVTVNPFNVCYYITDKCRGVIEAGFERVYGPMKPADKVIFVIFEIPDTGVFNEIIRQQHMPEMRTTDAQQTGDRRFMTSVYVGDKLLGHRHSTVKEFTV